MKKALLYTLALAMLLSLTACGGQAEEVPEETQQPEQTEEVI